ncbi:MAG: ABC transporter substrate-binding protein [Bacteroidota bacterium]
MKTLTVALDWTPNTNHIGFFVARELGFYDDLGLKVELLNPQDDNYALTPAKKVEMGHAHLALCPLESIISYQTKKQSFDAVAIVTLFQEDLSEIVVLEDSPITRPKELDGHSYASYKARYEDEIVRQMIVNDGGKGAITLTYPDKLGIWETLLSKKYDATWIFSNWEGVQARSKGVKLRAFRLSDYGIPYGYSPVIMASKKRVDDDQSVYTEFIKATRQGFLYAKNSPKEAVAILREHVSKQDSDIDLLASQLETIPAYGLDGEWGTFKTERVDDFLNWLRTTGLETAPLSSEHLIYSKIDF